MWFAEAWDAEGDLVSSVDRMWSMLIALRCGALDCIAHVQYTAIFRIYSRSFESIIHAMHFRAENRIGH